MAYGGIGCAMMHSEPVVNRTGHFWGNAIRVAESVRGNGAVPTGRVRAMLVDLVLILTDDDDSEAVIYRDIPAELLDRLMSTDDTVALAGIAREIQGYVRLADSEAATALADITPPLSGFGHGTD